MLVGALVEAERESITTRSGGVSFYGCSLAVKGIVGGPDELVTRSGELGVRGFGGLESPGEVASEGRRA